jgi:hypothetical protein
VEVFEPDVTVALPTALDRSEERRYRDGLVAHFGALETPAIAIPKFPDIPDVLKVPDVVFSRGSTGSLASEHISTLLDGRSQECSVPTALDKPVTPLELHLPSWTPTNSLPKSPEAPPDAVSAKPRISLRLPLYAIGKDATAPRKWLVGKLNTIVRGVHHWKILAFEEQKAAAQVEYDRTTLSNATTAVRFKTETAIWKSTKVEKDAELQAALTTYNKRVAQAQVAYKSRREQFEAGFSAASDRLSDFWRQVAEGQPEAVRRLFDIALARIVTPLAFPREWVLEYDQEHGRAMRLPPPPGRGGGMNASTDPARLDQGSDGSSVYR